MNADTHSRLLIGYDLLFVYHLSYMDEGRAAPFLFLYITRSGDGTVVKDEFEFEQ